MVPHRCPESGTSVPLPGVLRAALLSLVVSLLLEPAACAQGAGEQAPGPILSIPDPDFHWGKAFRGEQLEHTFTIENKGSAALAIESLKPNCGCMSVANESELKKTLQPGEKTSILLHIDTRILEPGPIKNKYIEVLSNALADENRLSIEGEIEDLLKLTPPHPSLEVIRAGAAASGPVTFTMEATGGRKVKILSLDPRQGILTATLRDVEKGRKYEVAVAPRLKDKKTLFQSEDLEMKLEVDGKPIPFRVQVSIKLRDRIEAQPSQSVYFRRTETAGLSGPDAQKLKKSLEIRSIGGPGHSFKVTGVVVKDGIFAAAVEPIEEGRRYRLNITLEKMPRNGERFLKDTIEVTTDDPEVPVLRIPVSAQF